MRLRADHKAELIAKVPLFGSCSKKDLRQIASIADEIDLPSGKALTRQGGVGREFFILLEGTADVERDGKPMTTFGAGDFFGEAALLSNEPRNATITTTSPTRALVITEVNFRRLLREQPKIQGKVLEALASRLPPGEI